MSGLARRAVCGLAACGLAVPVLVAAPASAAEPAVDVGWWTRSPGQDAPAGGLAVAAAPDGPSTVGALRVTLAGLASATVEVVETGGLNADGAAVTACATTSAWTATAGGAFAEAPEADCEAGSVELVRDAEARRWRGDLSSLVVDGAVSVVLVPGEASGAGVLGFEVRFAAPAVTATAAPTAGAEGGGSTPTTTGGMGSSTGGSATPPPASPPAPAPTPSPFAAGSGSTTVGGFGGAGAGGSASAPSFGAIGVPTPTAAGPVEAAGSAPQPLAEGPTGEVALGVDPGSTAVPAFTPLSGDEGAPGPRWGQALFFVVLSATAGAGAGVGNRLRRQRATTA